MVPKQVGSPDGESGSRLFLMNLDHNLKRSVKTHLGPADLAVTYSVLLDPKGYLRECRQDLAEFAMDIDLHMTSSCRGRYC